MSSMASRMSCSRFSVPWTRRCALSNSGPLPDAGKIVFHLEVLEVAVLGRISSSSVRKRGMSHWPSPSS